MADLTPNQMDHYDHVQTVLNILDQIAPNHTAFARKLITDNPEKKAQELIELARGTFSEVVTDVKAAEAAIEEGVEKAEAVVTGEGNAPETATNEATSEPAEATPPPEPPTATEVKATDGEPSSSTT